MKKILVTLAAVGIVSASCSPMVYRLSPAHSGKTLTLSGTVLAVEEDGDFLIETYGRLAFIDVGESEIKVEMGDQVLVTGTVDHDPDDSEAPELDATRISPRDG